MNPRLEEQVRTRAGGACEYCKVTDWQYDQPFHLDHIISKKHDGGDDLENLAYSCLDCNAHKGADIAGRDSQSNELVPLFNPRIDVWKDHFAWAGAVLVGRTPVGRVTIRLLKINDPLRVRARAILMEEGGPLS